METRMLGKIVLADDPVPADASCACLMGFEPNRIVHINEAARFWGKRSLARIDRVAETIKAPADPLKIVPGFQYRYAK
jgi:hypothetical protein